MASPSPEDGVEPAPAARPPAALPPAPVGLHGTARAFDPSQEEWGEYAERLVHYFVANDTNGTREETRDSTDRRRSWSVQTSENVGVSEETGRVPVR